MNAKHINRIGKFIKCLRAKEEYKAYIPKPLPPVPALDMEELNLLLEQANIAIGRLDGISKVLPDIHMFLYMYIRKEAVLSSQIEGTQSSLSDLLLFESNETPGVPIDDVTEVSNYVAAMEHGLKRIREGFPISLRLIKEIHGILLAKGRGSHKTPGEFRRSQNWIGGTHPGNARFVPPPPGKLMEVLDPLEKFLHDKKVKIPVLIKAALVHVQFETIHPFLDGNGRLGRLLITFILCLEDLLSQPLLYLSLYFKTNRQQYYDHLQLVREQGDWEAWIKFFLKGIIETAGQANNTAQAIIKMIEMDKRKIEQMGKPSASALIVHNFLQKHPITNVSRVEKNCNLKFPTISKSLMLLEELGIVKETTNKKRNRIYKYNAYLELLSKGTEPLNG